MFDAVHPQTHRNLQLGEGVLLRGVDLDAALLSDDPAEALATMMEDASCLIGATATGSTFRCVPAMLDATHGRRTPAVGETLAGAWEVTLSGSLLEITPANAAMLLNVPLYANDDSRAIIVPEPSPIPEAGGDICWVGDSGGGLIAIELHCPISIGGMVFRATRNGLGEAAFTLMAQKRTPDSSGLPCRLIWLKEALA